MTDLKAGELEMQDIFSDNESDDFILPKNIKKNRNFVIMDDDDDDLENDQNMNIIESLDNTQDEVFEDSDCDNYSENESGSEIELTEDTGVWEDDGDFKTFPFVAKSGLRKLPNAGCPYDFFELLFDNTFFSLIVNETNNFGENILREKWKELTIPEFKIFLSLLLHMGTIKCPRTGNYWNKSEQFGFLWFSRYMCRARFQNILRSLHFSSDNMNNHRLCKIMPVIDYFNNKMKEIYIPHRELSIDESLVPWRGRLMYKQFIAGKKHKPGVKLYIVCESSGTALRIKVYTGSEDDISGKGHVEKVVFHLMQDFLNKGHSVFMDNFYTSFALVEKLIQYKTYCTGTLRKTRKGNNSEVITKKLLKNEVISRYKNNVIVGKFKDKTDVLFISSEYKATLQEYENKYNRKIVQPIALHCYTNYMKGIDRKDQMLSYYSCTRRTFKWYTKLWINVVETLIFNSFNLYKKYTPSRRKLCFYEYRLDILKNLQKEFRDSHPDRQSPTPASNFHLPEILPRSNNRKIQRKICRQCYKGGKYRRSNYYCSGCVGMPGLCLGECFRTYHHLI